ncbi:hypothetical protein QTO34_005450 [Cnephaeus nilssonii]|uniref:Uncharacterized protein n=1 Tax=Cnephaeus nilssonii TaxID=3371016 RepID=A0AA40HND9_CNENI|nr:hypothetical protein QTO34_005450 [Eptesicus nilssonii]
MEPHSHCHHSHTLTVPALLVPTDGAEQLGPVPAAGVCGANTFSRYKWWLLQSGLQPPLTSADGAERLGLAPGSGSGCKQKLQCRLRV